MSFHVRFIAYNTKPKNMSLGELNIYKFPKGFSLIVDTREQQSLFNGEINSLVVINKKLDFGDYSIKGFEEQFCVERKMISDFYGYIGRERKKTIRKMNEFKDIMLHRGFVGLAIEASEEDIMFGYMYSQLSPEVVRQALCSFRVRYGVHIYFNKSREYLRRWILDNAIKFYNIKRETS